MDFFEKIEIERKRIEREKNREMKDFVTKKLNLLNNLKYLLEECYGKNINNIFDKHSGYKIYLDNIINGIEDVIEISSKITVNPNISESQATISNNKYEINLILPIDEKREFISWFKEFEYIFNGLNEIERKLIYYSLIEKESNTWLALKTNYSERTIRNLKLRAINNFYKKLKLGNYTYKETLKIRYNNF